MTEQWVLDTLKKAMQSSTTELAYADAPKELCDATRDFPGYVKYFSWMEHGNDITGYALQLKRSDSSIMNIYM
jgi:hypothetical protein